MINLMHNMLQSNTTFTNAINKEIITNIEELDEANLVSNLSQMILFTSSFLLSIDYSQLLHQPECPGWVPLNHVYYQVANLFLLVSSLSSNILFLRAMLVVSCSFSTLWEWTVACGLDTTSWNCLMTVINLAWCLQTVWGGRTVTLSQEMEMVNMQVFKQLKVSRRQFKVRIIILMLSLHCQFQTLLGVTKEMRKLSPKEVIIEEKVTRVDSLSQVLSRR